MAFQFCSFASGSSGNCYLVKSDQTNLLVDVGISGKRVLGGLSCSGLNIEDVNGILITHEHSDHVQSLKMIGKKAINANVYGSVRTLEGMADRLPAGRVSAIENPMEPFVIGDINVIPFHLSHDAVEPVGYAFEHKGRRMAIVTDTGYITDEIYANIATGNLLVLEANHEVNILKMGPYPYSLKRRILGEEGHLSNEAAGQCICHLLHDREEDESQQTEKLTVVLAHLSKKNNTPKQAYLTVRNILFEEELYIGKDLELSVVDRDDVSPLMDI